MHTDSSGQDGRGNLACNVQHANAIETAHGATDGRAHGSTHLGAHVQRWMRELCGRGRASCKLHGVRTGLCLHNCASYCVSDQEADAFTDETANGDINKDSFVEPNDHALAVAYSSDAQPHPRSHQHRAHTEADQHAHKVPDICSNCDTHSPTHCDPDGPDEDTHFLPHGESHVQRWMREVCGQGRSSCNVHGVWS